jgi:hypothetical protein
LPRKVWTAGDVLAAADVNTYLGDQVISVFADAAARDASITSPLHGMACYLQDTDALELYDGSAWESVASSGLASIITDTTTARTLTTAADSGKTILFTNAGATTVTVDASTDLAVGARVDIIQDGAGVVTVTADGATIKAAEISTTSGSFTIGAQYSAATLLCVATDEYRLIGNITAV